MGTGLFFIVISALYIMAMIAQFHEYSKSHELHTSRVNFVMWILS